MLVAAFVGGGIGAVMFFLLVSAFGLTILEANATYSLPVLVLTTVRYVPLYRKVWLIIQRGLCFSLAC